VYWNTGLHDSRENHWLRLRFSGVTNGELIGARVEAREPATAKLLGTRWIHPNHSYKSGGALEAHFGLGTVRKVDLAITTLSGRKITIDGVDANRFLDVDLSTRAVKEVGPEQPA
ncbi:MAG: ASPIC/UnbV domain-containing protein, partial [Candidatus Zipacnadales bacterium]